VATSIDNFQRLIHVTSEAAAIAGLPMMIGLLHDPDLSRRERAFVRGLVFGTALVDGVLIMRWADRRP
jgi:hypothetical protein